MITGIPLHPLLVHFAVVLVPLSALMMLMAVFSQNARERLGSWLPWLGAATAISAMAAKHYGEELEHALGAHSAAIEDHARMGDVAGLAGLVLGTGAICIWVLTSARTRPWVISKVAFLKAGWAMPAVRVLTILVSLWSVAGIVFAGHSGAASVWCTH